MSYSQATWLFERGLIGFTSGYIMDTVTYFVHISSLNENRVLIVILNYSSTSKTSLSGVVSCMQYILQQIVMLRPSFLPFLWTLMESHIYVASVRINFSSLKISLDVFENNDCYVFPRIEISHLKLSRVRTYDDSLFIAYRISDVSYTSVPYSTFAYLLSM